VSRDGPQVRLVLGGAWTLADGVPPLAPLADQLDATPFRRLSFDTRSVTAWDTALVTFAFAVGDLASWRDVELDLEGLPPAARKLLALARAVPPRTLTPPGKLFPDDDSEVSRSSPSGSVWDGPIVCDFEPPRAGGAGREGAAAQPSV
jgi:hypothetical protein